MDVKIKKNKNVQAKYFGLIAILAVTLFFLKDSFLTNTLTTLKLSQDKVIVAPVQQGEFDDFIRINGTVAPIATIYLDAYEGGSVKEKLVEEGMMVKKGDIILKLENRALYEQILASETNLAVRQNDLRTTKINFDTRQLQAKKEYVALKYQLIKAKRSIIQKTELYEDKIISRDDYLEAKEHFELTQENHAILQLQTQQDSLLRRTTMQDLDEDLKRMKKTLKMVYGRLDQLNVRAPADGQLGFLDAEVGQSLKQGDPIGQINILKAYKIEAQIDEHYIDRINRNLQASFQKEAETYTLRIKKIYPEVRNGKFKVDLVFTDNQPQQLHSGQSYSIKLKLGESKQALLIPRGSFYQHTGGQWIFIVDETGTQAVRRNITIGKQNAKYYEILEGLVAGEKVITSNYRDFAKMEKLILQ
ncbi:MAG: efflux RND transporter periplasmic adaptor subunit [Saprospiraceae bacterium]